MVDKNSSQSLLYGANTSHVSNVLEQENSSEAIQPTTSQMAHGEQDSTLNMANQQFLESNKQGRPWLNLGWNHAPNRVQRQHAKNKTSRLKKNQRFKNLSPQNIPNHFILENQQNNNLSLPKKDTYMNWNPNNDNNIHSNMNDWNNYDRSPTNLNQNSINPSSTNDFQSLHNESYEGIDEFSEKGPQNGMDFNSKPSNMNDLLYSQDEAYDTNNYTNASQQLGYVDNFNSHGNSSNPMFNFHCTPQKQSLNFQCIPQEQQINFQCSPQGQGSGLNHGLQINPNSKFNLHCTPQHEGLVCNHSSSNVTCQEIAHVKGNNFQHLDVSKSQGLLPNMNSTLNPLGINTTFNPHGSSPSLNITYSPTFHTSPSTLPTTPKSKVIAQGLNIEEGAKCLEKKQILNCSYNIVPNKACNTPITTNLDNDPSLNLKNSHHHFCGQHHHMCIDLCPSTPKDNPTKDFTPYHCSPNCHQGHFPIDKIQISQESSLDFHASQKNIYESKNSIIKLREKSQSKNLNDCSSESEYDQSSTCPTTKKKSLCLASKKMKSCRDCLEEENDCSSIPMWIQKTIVLPVQRRGCHNITHLV